MLSKVGDFLKGVFFQIRGRENRLKIELQLTCKPFPVEQFVLLLNPVVILNSVAFIQLRLLLAYKEKIVHVDYFILYGGNSFRDKCRSRTGVHNSILMAGQKKIIAHLLLI